ncbi:TPA: hypothetical protein ACOQ5G_005731 [Bacillus cereus]
MLENHKGVDNMALSAAALEAKREYQRQWREKNRERCNAYMNKWRKENPEKVKGYMDAHWEKKAAAVNELS